MADSNGLKQIFDRFFKRHHVPFNHSPYSIEIDPHVVVDQDVSQTGNITPANFRAKGFGCFTQMFYCFANDFKIAYHCILVFFYRA